VLEKPQPARSGVENGLKMLMYSRVHCACWTGCPTAAKPRDGRERRSAVFTLSRTRLRFFQHTRWLVVSSQGKTVKKVLPEPKLVLQGVMRSDMYQLDFDFGGKASEDYQFNTFALVQRLQRGLDRDYCRLGYRVTIYTT
jgi:hypothetical protein